MSACLTYFAFSKSLAAIKIGKSTDIGKRIKQMRTSCPDIRIVLKLEGDLEADLHRRFAQLRHSGKFRTEWFRAQGELLEYLWEQHGIRPGGLNRSNVEGLARHFNQKRDDNRYLTMQEAAKRLCTTVKALRYMALMHPYLPKIERRRTIKWGDAKAAKTFYEVKIQRDKSLK